MVGFKLGKGSLSWWVKEVGWKGCEGRAAVREEGREGSLIKQIMKT